MNAKYLTFLLISTMFLLGCGAKNMKNDLNSAVFQHPPKSVHLHTWWHWMDGAITKEGITKDLEAMHQQGIVQATILNIGLFGDANFGVKQVKFNTVEWYDMFKWALKEANRLHISIGIHNCDGWSSSGGPWVTPEQSMKQYTWSKKIIEGGQKVQVNLKKPFGLMDFFKDVAVVAFKSGDKNSFQKADPKILFNNEVDASILKDGNPISGFLVKKGATFLVVFNNWFSAEKLVLHNRRVYLPGSKQPFSSMYKLSASDDGKKYREVKEFEVRLLNEPVTIDIPQGRAKFYKLEIVNSSIPFDFTEIELLKKNEILPLIRKFQISW